MVVRTDGGHVTDIAELGRKARALLPEEIKMATPSQNASPLIRPYNTCYAPHEQREAP